MHTVIESVDNTRPKLTITSDVIRIKVPGNMSPDAYQRVIKIFNHIIADIGFTTKTLRGTISGDPFITMKTNCGGVCKTYFISEIPLD